jgi:chaperonin GroEL
MCPVIEAMAVRPSLGTPGGREVLRGVAKVSANGDEELADAVLACFDVIGDEGNVTLTEAAGPSKYLVQKVEGYPIPIGYEDSCGFAANKFVNDISTQSCVMENPVFLLYFGKITDFNSLWPIIQTVTEEINSGTEVKGHKVTHNFVVAATGFTEEVLANLAVQFPAEGMINVYPLRVPMAPVKSGTYDFLLDLAAITGATVFDALEKPLQNFSIEDLGIGPRMFEATRFRSSIIGHLDGDLVLARVDQIQKQLGETAISELEKNLLRERLAKITSGIARLIVQGSSHGEIKERRDRAEDAICAVRGAIKHGALPGGGVCLAALSAGLSDIGTSHPEMGEGTAEIASAVASQALLEPVRRLYSNAGYSPDETSAMIERLSELETFDLYNERWVDPQQEGLLDSLPAVKEAIRNAISVAASAGTCGGIISFPRDLEMERDEARDTADFLRHAGINEADTRP